MSDEIRLAHQLRTFSAVMQEPTKSVMIVVAEMLERFDDRVTAATEEFCDAYCQWPDICEDNAALKKVCAGCPLTRVLEGKT